MSDESTTLFLGDLSVFCTEKDIRKLFRPFGTIEAIRVKRGSSSKTNLSYGFIKFSQREAAELALQQLTGIMFLGRALRIGWAEGKNSPKALAIQESAAPTNKSVETAQVHVSFISKQVDILISEATLRALFGMYGEVVDVALKKSQFDRNLKIQNGYGFVHYALTQEGIQAAFNAVASLHQVTIDRVTYDCSVSHALEGLIVPPTVTEVPKPPAYMQQGQSPNMRYGGPPQQGQLPPTAMHHSQQSGLPAYGQLPQGRGGMVAPHGSSPPQNMSPSQSMYYGGNGAMGNRNPISLGANLNTRGAPPPNFNGGYESAAGYHQPGQYNRDMMGREPSPYGSSGRGMPHQQSILSQQQAHKYGSGYQVPQTAFSNSAHHASNNFPQQQQHSAGYNPRPTFDGPRGGGYPHHQQQQYNGGQQGGMGGHFDHHSHNSYGSGPNQHHNNNQLGYQQSGMLLGEQDFHQHPMLRNELKDDFRAERSVRSNGLQMHGGGDGLFETSPQPSHFDTADTIFDFSQLSLAPSSSSSSAMSEPSKFSGSESHNSSFHDRSPRVIGGMDGMTRSHSDIMMSPPHTSPTESFLQLSSQGGGESLKAGSNNHGNAYHVYPPSGSTTGSGSVLGSTVQPPVGHYYNNEPSYNRSMGGDAFSAPAQHPSFQPQHARHNHPGLMSSRSQSIEDIIDSSDQADGNSQPYYAEDRSNNNATTMASFGSYRDHANSDLSAHSAGGSYVQ